MTSVFLKDDCFFIFADPLDGRHREQFDVGCIYFFKWRTFSWKDASPAEVYRNVTKACVIPIPEACFPTTSKGS